MKKTILTTAFGLLVAAASAQVVEESIAMGQGYANQIYYKLGAQTENSYPASSWDIAFNRQSAFSMGIRSNAHKGIEVYEASDNVADWANINVEDIESWTPLYNSETEWETGSFDNGSATYGWGEYNMANHHVTGSIIFVLKYSATSFKKIKFDDFFSGYTFTYSSWNGTEWSADTTAQVMNNTNTTQLYNYYNLETGQAVVAEPAATEWDFVFTKYLTDYFGDGSIMYPVTGVMHHPDVTVAENTEADGPAENPTLTYSSDITTIGDDWKTFTGGTYVVHSDIAYYIKSTDDEVYRLTFNTFAGSSTGEVTFNYENVTDQLSTIDNSLVSFGVFPNPSKDKRINIVYESATTSANSVNISNLNGARVFATELSSNGFHNQSVDLSSLTAGVYLLEFTAGDFKEVKKIVLQ